MKNQKILEEFEAEEKAKGNSERSVGNRIAFLNMLDREVNCDFKTITKAEINKFLNNRTIKPSTKNNYIENLQSFFTWLGRKKVVEHLKQRVIPEDLVDAKDLVTEDEIILMIETATNPRDKACIALLYDLAIERKCISTLNVGDIEIDGESVYVTVLGKKRGSRMKRKMKCLSSAPYVLMWLENHPSKNINDAPFFISLSPNNYGQRVHYNFPYELLRLLAKRAGITKRVWCHGIRHSKLTDLYKRGLRGVSLQRYAGWTNGNMEQRYVNLSPEELDEARESAENHTAPKTKPIEVSKLKPVECPRCSQMNEATAHHCGGCWFPLRRDVVEETETTTMLLKKLVVKLIEKHPEEATPEMVAILGKL